MLYGMSVMDLRKSFKTWYRKVRGGYCFGSIIKSNIRAILKNPTPASIKNAGKRPVRTALMRLDKDLFLFVNRIETLLLVGKQQRLFITQPQNSEGTEAVVKEIHNPVL